MPAFAMAYYNIACIRAAADKRNSVAMTPRIIASCIIAITCSNVIFCTAFTPPTTSSASLQQIQRHAPTSSALTSKLQALPLDDIILQHSLSSLSSSSNILLSSTSTSDVLAAAEAFKEVTAVEPISILDKLLHIPSLWSIFAMTSIVGLLVAWEESIENIKHNTPKPILPVIDSMLAEVGGLGFIGLFLSTVVTGGPLGRVIESLSENYLGDDELLLETFEFLHTFFFQVGILFFVIAGVVVGAVLKDVQSLQSISELALDADGDGEVTLDELADALEVESMIVDLDGDGEITSDEMTEALRGASTNINSFSTFFKELQMSEKDRAGEQLLIRERMMEQMNLPQTFAVEDYFSEIFGHDLEEVVELSPVTWLPLIPLIAVDNSVDLSSDVVSASSSNAFDSCGYFFATPWVLYSTLFLQVISLVWAVFNSWKVASIKQMIVPTLVKETSDSEAILLPPRYEDEYLLEKFNSSPGIFGWGEQFFTGGGSKMDPPRNSYEQLFGAAGAKFPETFRASIQLHTWLSVTLIVYSVTQVVLRDAAALYLSAPTGSPEYVVPELVLWSVFASSAMFQLTLSPNTFLNYCFVTNVEEFVKKDVVKKCTINYVEEYVSNDFREEEKRVSYAGKDVNIENLVDTNEKVLKL